MAVIQDFAREVRERIVSENLQPSLVPQLIGQAFHERALSGDFFQDEAGLSQAVTDELFEYGVLQPFLKDPQIEELWINRPDEVIIARSGKVSRISLALDSDTIRTLILRMLRATGRRIDTSLPFADAILDDGSRLHVVIPDVTARHWSVNIRKFPPASYSLNDLVDKQMMTETQADFLREATRKGRNILISGATHSGKTTLLTALLNELPSETRLISCEETFELRSELPDWVAMQARQPNLEGQGEIPLRRLVKESLRMRPDRLVIGEVREAEALDLLVAMNSGVSGACTIHANSAQSAITKLCTLPLLAGPNISAEFVRRTVADAIDLVVHCRHIGGGVRKISQITRVSGGTDGIPTVEDVKC